MSEEDFDAALLAMLDGEGHAGTEDATGDDTGEADDPGHTGSDA
jgi:hypothetical protein